MKMSISKTLKRTTTILKKHLPDILSYGGAVGVVATSVLSGKAAIKAHKEIEDIEAYCGGEINGYAKFFNTWHYYIPTFLVGSATIGCIVSSNIIYGRRYSDLVAAYTLLANTYRDYQDKVIETYGEEAHEEIVKSIAVDKASDIPLYAYETSGASMLDFGVDDGWQHLFYLRCADRFFTSTISKVLQAEYYVNRNLMMGHPVSLADFTILLGLEPDRGEAEVGWPIIDELCWVDFSHYVAKSGDKCYPRELDLPEECPFDPDIFVIDCYFDPVAEYNYE